MATNQVRIAVPVATRLSHGAGSLLGALSVLGALFALGGRGRAQDLTFERAVQLLSSPNRAEVEIAIQTFGLLGSPRAVDPLSQRIRDGLPPDLLESAVDTLMVLGRPEAGPVLFELLNHRRPTIRLRAVQAIAVCRPRGADRALASALADLDPLVRAEAARALGELGAASAVESLFLAFDRHVPEAAAALGRVAQAEHVARIVAYLGRVPFAEMRVLLGALLGRRDIAERAKLEVVGRVGELATPEARAFLEEITRSLPSSEAAVRRAAEAAAARIVP
jgi:HEAT repeat protein